MSRYNGWNTISHTCIIKCPTPTILPNVIVLSCLPTTRQTRLAADVCNSYNVHRHNHIKRFKKDILIYRHIYCFCYCPGKRDRFTVKKKGSGSTPARWDRTNTSVIKLKRFDALRAKNHLIRGFMCWSPMYM